MPRFADRLAELRKENNLSQTELSNKLGISRGRLANYECGTRTPDYDTLDEMADLFNVDMEYLLGYSDKKGPTQDEMDSVLSAQELDIIRLFRKIPPDQQQTVLNMIRAALNIQQ